MDATRPKSEFYAKFGSALARARFGDLTGQWKGPDCVLEIAVHDSKFAAAGAYEIRNALTPIAFGVLHGASRASETYEVTYSGIARGRTIQAEVKREPQGTRRSAGLLNANSSRNVLMIVSDFGDSIDVMELVKAGDPRFYSIKKIVS